ncbi:MAG: septum formation inhibitor Maf [Betaproteobacteria bacterium]|nr:septum formation inhibitor Maf [Betaproteobacteria bacterium]
MQLDRSIYLASRSPRRQELLAQIGVKFEAMEIDVDESVTDGESPRAYVERLARAKAETGWRRVERDNLARAPVLGADTTVAIDGRILAKPADDREAAAMLAALSGRQHEVLTAVAVKYDSRLESAVSISEVRFKTLSKEEIARYVATGECEDKAGAYGIQGHAARFVAELRGSFSGVVGLPLYETAQLLDRIGYPA